MTAMKEKLVDASHRMVSPSERWQAASFLLFFMAVINVWGALVTLPQPFWACAAKTPAASLWVKQVVAFALPLTNALVGAAGVGGEGGGVLLVWLAACVPAGGWVCGWGRREGGDCCVSRAACGGERPAGGGARRGR
jgi:hypothetical protein